MPTAEDRDRTLTHYLEFFNLLRWGTRSMGCSFRSIGSALSRRLLAEPS